MEPSYFQDLLISRYKNQELKIENIEQIVTETIRDYSSYNGMTSHFIKLKNNTSTLNSSFINQIKSYTADIKSTALHIVDLLKNDTQNKTDSKTELNNLCRSFEDLIKKINDAMDADFYTPIKEIQDFNQYCNNYGITPDISNKMDLHHYLKDLAQTIESISVPQKGETHLKNTKIETLETIQKIKNQLVQPGTTSTSDLNDLIKFIKKILTKKETFDVVIEKINTLLKDNKKISKTVSYIFRIISTDEFESLKMNRAFTQKLSCSTSENAKWFYHGKGNPSIENNHLCKIQCIPGTLELIQSLSEMYSDVILTKENEPDCFGVHEEVLSDFNLLISNVKITSKNGKTCEITFNEQPHALSFFGKKTEHDSPALNQNTSLTQCKKHN